MSLLGRLHGSVVVSRRARVLSSVLAEYLSQRADVLDVGCGDGMISRLVQKTRPDISIRGIDVVPRPQTYIQVDLFDGKRIQFPDSAFDTVVLVDVLHHTTDPTALLNECSRVSKGSVLIKDHVLRGLLARSTLRLMDWVGNAPHGVPLPYNYLTTSQWRALFRAVGLRVAARRTKLRLYPPPFTWVFDRSLHFVALLEKAI
jgi:ubiquinone/menaquinone biosynthesis C-methylase UbiE